MAVACSTELGFKGQIYVEGRTKESERTRNQNEEGMEKRGTEQSNRERKQRPKRGNVGDAMEEMLRMLYKTLPFTATLLKMKMKDRAIFPICSLVYPDDGRFWIACDGCND